MNVVVNSQVLAVELRLLNKVIPAKPTIAILGYAIIQADGPNQRLNFYATDLEVGLQTRCVAMVQLAGAVVLPAARLLSMVEQFPDAPVSIAADGTTVTIKCGTFTTRLQSLEPRDFPIAPLPPTTSTTHTLSAPALRQLIARTRFAVDANGTKHVLRGALLALTDKAGAMVTTDGKRLTLSTMGRAGSEPARAIIPAKTLDMLMDQADDDVVEYTVGTTNLFFAAGKRMLNSRMIDADFPKYDRIIPRGNGTKIQVDRVALAAALRRVGLVTEQNYATFFRFEHGSLELASSAAGVGDADERLSISYEGPSLQLCCNWKYVLDFLDAASSAYVAFHLKDSATGMLLTDGDSYLAVIMPMRV